MEEVDERSISGAGEVVIDDVAVILDEREAGDALEDVGEEAAMHICAGVVDTVGRVVAACQADRFVHIGR